MIYEILRRRCGLALGCGVRGEGAPQIRGWPQMGGVMREFQLKPVTGATGVRADFISDFY